MKGDYEVHEEDEFELSMKMKKQGDLSDVGYRKKRGSGLCITTSARIAARAPVIWTREMLLGWIDGSTYAPDQGPLECDSQIVGALDYSMALEIAGNENLVEHWRVIPNVHLTERVIELAVRHLPDEIFGLRRECITEAILRAAYEGHIASLGWKAESEDCEFIKKIITIIYNIRDEAPVLAHSSIVYFCTKHPAAFIPFFKKVERAWKREVFLAALREDPTLATYMGEQLIELGLAAP
jgi:hypothetical protein